MKRSLIALAVTLLGLVAAGRASVAAPAQGRHMVARLPVAASLGEGQMTAGPRAFADFCDTYPEQCLTAGTGDAVPLDAERWGELQQVNAAVNRRIRPQAEVAGADVWKLGASAGDCDEFAVEKRRELLDRGWPSASLLLAVAHIASGEAHLVLTVRTESGDFVLDNLRSGVLPAEKTGYRWLMRQSTLHPRLWVRVNGTHRGTVLVAQLAKKGKAPAVAAVRSRQPAMAVPVAPKPVEPTPSVAPAAPAEEASAKLLKSVPPVDFTAMQAHSLPGLRSVAALSTPWRLDT